MHEACCRRLWYWSTAVWWLQSGTSYFSGHGTFFFKKNLKRCETVSFDISHNSIKAVIRGHNPPGWFCSAEKTILLCAYITFSLVIYDIYDTLCEPLAFTPGESKGEPCTRAERKYRLPAPGINNWANLKVNHFIP